MTIPSFRRAQIFLLPVLCFLLQPSCSERKEDAIRIGHFPNLTHVQALVAHNMAREGKDWFAAFLPPGTKVEYPIFNAGPGAMEALLGGSVAAAYVGPSPVINAFTISGARGIRLLSAAVRGGSALLVPDKGEASVTAGALRGKRLGTPQPGNTQDVAARAWLAKHGLQTRQNGTGDVFVLSHSNAMLLTLFRQGKLDAVWTVEPWVSLFEREAKAKVLLRDDRSTTTVLAVSADFCAKYPGLVRKLREAHRALTQWILEHPEEAKRRVVDELALETRNTITPRLVEQAWSHLSLEDKTDEEELQQFIDDARAAGFIGTVPPLEKLFIPE